MSTYRTISRNRHIDERIMAVGPTARAVWDYLCCNQQDHASGLYRLSISTTSEDTGWTPEQVQGALAELVAVQLIERDERRRLVWVRNMLHWSYPKIGKSDAQRKSVESHLRSMPRTALVERLIAYYSDRYGVDLDAGARDDDGSTGSQADPETLPRDPPNGRALSDRVGIGSESDRTRAREDDDSDGGKQEEIPGAQTEPSSRTSAKTRARSREADPELVANANAVIDRLNERRAWIANRFQLPGVQQFRHAKGNRVEITRVLAEGEPVERLLLVVDAAAREVAQKRGEGLEWLTPITPFRESNWPRYLGKVGAPSRAANEHAAAETRVTDPREARAIERETGRPPTGWQRVDGGLVGPNGQIHLDPDDDDSEAAE